MEDQESMNTDLKNSSTLRLLKGREIHQQSSFIQGQLTDFDRHTENSFTSFNTRKHKQQSKHPQKLLVAIEEENIGKDDEHMNFDDDDLDSLDNKNSQFSSIAP